MENNIKIHLTNINTEKISILLPHVVYTTPCELFQQPLGGKLFSIQYNNSQKAVYTYLNQPLYFKMRTRSRHSHILSLSLHNDCDVTINYLCHFIKDHLFWN